MNTLASQYQTIVDLHERGYTDDFKFVGKGVLWVQQKIILRRAEFSITDYYQVHADDPLRQHKIILGILLASINIKGILICHTSACQATSRVQNKISSIAFTEELQQNPAYPIRNNLLLKSK